jgi:DNA adenine methylase
MTTLNVQVVKPIPPFLKWPGGKRWAASVIGHLVRKNLNGTYFEPFLGGGAVFFWLQPQTAVLSDINQDLINTYCVVRRHPKKLMAGISNLTVSKSAYYRLRSSAPTDSVERAIRFIYLNRTAFSGLYRVNSSGRFNVPYGGGERTPQILLDTPLLLNASKVLTNAEIKCCDFEEILGFAKRGDVVYCDPTYTVTHDSNGFIRYNERNFSWKDQQRLAKAATRAAQKGVTVLVSNAHHEAIRGLYPGAKFAILERQSTLCANSSKRRTVNEFLIIV